MALATLTNKGQVTIPKSVRELLGIHSGDKLEFVVIENGKAYIRPVTKKVDDVYGRLYKPDRKPVSVDEMNEKIKTAARLEIFGKFAQAAGQGFFMTDLDGRVTYANPAMCAITGCAVPEELVGKNIFDFYENIFKDIIR